RGRVPGAHAARRAAGRRADRRHGRLAEPRARLGTRAAGSAAVSGTRVWEIFKQEIQFHSRRPLLWVQLLILGFLAYIISEFAISQLLIFMSCLIYVFFASVAAGMSMIRDDEAKVGELLHSTPL